MAYSGEPVDVVQHCLSFVLRLFQPIASEASPRGDSTGVAVGTTSNVAIIIQMYTVGPHDVKGLR